MKIGPFDTEKRVFIIAEVGVNHGGNLRDALRLVNLSADAGADAVKFQTFNADLFPEPQRSICKPLELSRNEFLLLHEYCSNVGILFLSTPFDRESVDFLDPLVPAFKIGSGQAKDAQFMLYVEQKGKPLIVSTGMMEGTWAIGYRVPIEYLHCVSQYPCPPENANLQRMVQKKMHGYSDHTEGIEIPVAAVALGARIIEKHITLDRTQAGPDHTSSVEPHQFKEMVRMIRNVEKALC